LLANRIMMERYIKANGHLIMDGTESTNELREALLYLRQHTQMHCMRPELGTPIEAFIPDITALTGNATGRKRPVQNVVTPDERL
jgi:hypothetical protein